MENKLIAHRLFAQAVVLLILYLAVTLFGAVQFLSNDPTTQSIPYHQVSAFSHILLNLSVLTGLLGGGLLMADTSSSIALLWTSRGWTVLLVLAFVVGIFGMSEGRHMLEMPMPFDIMQAVLTAAFMTCILLSTKKRSDHLIVWMVGIGIVALSTLISVLNISDMVRGSILDGTLVGLIVNIGYPLATTAILFWLIGESRVFIAAGMIAVAGALITVGMLHPLNPDALSTLLGTIGAMAAPIAYFVFAALTYRTASRWQMLTILMLLFGGVLGGVLAFPNVNQWTQGTRLSDLQTTLMLWAALAVILGVIQHVFERQGIWGNVGFWLTVFGIGLGCAAWAGIGLVQSYLERILSIGYLDTQTYLIPLYLVWVIGLLVLALGIAVFALRLVLRRA